MTFAFDVRFKNIFIGLLRFLEAQNRKKTEINPQTTMEWSDMVWYKSSFLLSVQKMFPWTEIIREGQIQFPEICLSLSANHHHDDLHE